MILVSAQHVLQLAIIVAQLSGRSIPTVQCVANPMCQPPNVYEVNDLEMGAQCKCSNDVGLYKDGNEIYVNKEFIDSANNVRHLTEDSVIVHELTHWLQNEHAEGSSTLNTCEHRQAIENEAYRVQNQYIWKYEEKPSALIAPDVCSEPSRAPGHYVPALDTITVTATRPKK